MSESAIIASSPLLSSLTVFACLSLHSLSNPGFSGGCWDLLRG